MIIEAPSIHRNRFFHDASTAPRADKWQSLDTHVISNMTTALPERRQKLGTFPSYYITAEFYMGASARKEISGHPAATSDDMLLESNLPPELHVYLPKIYLLERKQRARAASKLIMSLIEMKFANSDLVTVNSLIATIELERLSVFSMSGLIRCSARAKSHLPAWASTFNKAKTLLRKRGEDVDGIFAGLAE